MSGSVRRAETGERLLEEEKSFFDVCALSEMSKRETRRRRGSEEGKVAEVPGQDGKQDMQLDLEDEVFGLLSVFALLLYFSVIC